MKQAGTIPTAYGVTVPVYGPFDEADPESFCFDMDGTAKMAGIYDPDTRRRFAEAAKDSDRIRLEDFGGHAIPKVTLPRPRRPVYPTLPKGDGVDIPIEKWIDRVMDLPRWCDRSAALMEIIGSNLDQAKTWKGMPPEIIGIGLGQLLTATLEHLTETEIDCLEAAAFYSLSMHDEWRAAGRSWLEPFKATWFSDWLDRHRPYRRFAWITSRIHDDIPTWIASGGAS